MYDSKAKRCDDRIVSISQPYMRPIVRGKLDKPTEFGAKLSVSLSAGGVVRVDHLRWDAFHEGHDLPSQVEAYREHHGVYPELRFPAWQREAFHPAGPMAASGYCTAGEATSTCVLQTLWWSSGDHHFMLLDKLETARSIRRGDGGGHRMK